MISQEEYNRIVDLIISPDEETAALGISLMNSLVPEYTSIIAYSLYIKEFPNYDPCRSFSRFWLNYIQAHFVK